MSTTHMYEVSDDDEYEIVNSSDNELELLDLGDDSLDLQITGVSEKSADKLRQNASIKYPDSEIQRYKLSKGCIITPGTTVELKDHSSHAGDDLHSADFLRVKHIIIDLDTNKMRLRGHRLRRLKYLGQIFDWKFNELVMVLRAYENETRCPFVAGMEDITIDQVLRLRDCVITNKPYPLLGLKDGPRCAFAASLSRQEVKQQLFHGGRLACRVVNIGFLCNNGKPYSGIVRQLYAREADKSALAGPADGPGLSRKDAIPLDDDAWEDAASGVSNSQQKKRRASVGSSERKARKRISPLPTRAARLTFGDCFCCAGGASQGAKQAGLHVVWALDLEEQAMHAYSRNHPGALPFCQNAHDFPPEGYTEAELRVDILHLSPPCKYFSPAHTRDGKNDQANLEAIYTVGPILKKVQPRVATLEQTFGLYNKEEHKAVFNMLLRDIGAAGYNVRYRVQNMVDFGLVQPRKRLLIIAARRGIPLPPFPKPTHGPPGSGLKPYRYIKDALLPIERLAHRPTSDPQHIPKFFPADKRREPYSPRTFLNGCITEKGSSTYHYSGTRKYTPREISLFQSFPFDYKFSGVMTHANAQIGNAYPPVVAEAVFRSVAKTLEAFDKGYIDAEDDLSDLDGILERKGAPLRHQEAPACSLFDPSPCPKNQVSRYLVREDAISRQAAPTNSSPFIHHKESRAQQQRLPVEETTRKMREISLLDGLLDGTKDNSDDEWEVESIESRRRRRSAPIIKNSSKEVIEISSESESEEGDETNVSFAGKLFDLRFLSQARRTSIT